MGQQHSPLDKPSCLPSLGFGNHTLRQLNPLATCRILQVANSQTEDGPPCLTSTLRPCQLSKLGALKIASLKRAPDSRCPQLAQPTLRGEAIPWEHTRFNGSAGIRGKCHHPDTTCLQYSLYSNCESVSTGIQRAIRQKERQQKQTKNGALPLRSFLAGPRLFRLGSDRRLGRLAASCEPKALMNQTGICVIRGGLALKGVTLYELVKPCC